MKSKKKLIIALSSFAFVLVAAVVTVTAVLAAANQSVTSNVSVVYNAKLVAGTVTASYKVGNTDAVSMGSITYTGAEATGNEVMSPEGDITLTATDGSTGAVTAQEVVFTYTFTNTGSADYLATLTYQDVEATDTNVDVTYGSNLAVEDDGSYTITIPANTTTPIEVTVTVAINNVALNAEFSGTFGWALEAQAQA